MSAEVTDPYSVSFSPTRRAIAMSTSASRAASASACDFSSSFRASALRALALDLPLVAVGDRQRQLARQQVVAGVAVGDLHDVAAAPEVVDVFSQNDFHDVLDGRDCARVQSVRRQFAYEPVS